MEPKRAPHILQSLGKAKDTLKENDFEVDSLKLLCFADTNLR